MASSLSSFLVRFPSACPYLSQERGHNISGPLIQDESWFTVYLMLFPFGWLAVCVLVVKHIARLSEQNFARQR
jgi:hypothetical protein